MKKLNYLFLLISGIVIFGMTSCQKEPSASFTTDRVKVGTTDTVNFTNTSKDGDNYEWNFGDGTTSKLENPTHTFSTEGTYTVTLKAFSKNGKKSSEVVTTIKVVANNLEYDNKKYILTNGLLMKNSVTNHVYEMIVTLYSGYKVVSSGNNITSMTGTGNYIKFLIYANDTIGLSPNVFNYSYLYNVGTFKTAEFAVEYVLAKNVSVKYPIVAGTLNVKKEGDYYEISIDCTAENTKAIKGSFYGKLKYFNPYYPS